MKIKLLEAIGAVKSGDIVDAITPDPLDETPYFIFYDSNKICNTVFYGRYELVKDDTTSILDIKHKIDLIKIKTDILILKANPENWSYIPSDVKAQLEDILKEVDKELL